MEITSVNEKKVADNSSTAKNEILNLATSEFFSLMDKFSNAINEDIKKLSIEEQVKSKEIIDGFNKRLEFIESYKSEENVSEEMKEKIYDDFNKTASELGEYEITVYKAKNKEKTIKQIIGGVIDVVKVIGLSSVAIALIKKGKN
jgi:predicted DNA-binding protein YlxM (UPF0122 family)